MCSKLTTPAPGNSRQTPIFNPTPNTHFVPQCVLGVGFHVCFGIYGAGVASDEGLGWCRERGFRGGAEGQIRGPGGEKRVIDDDDR